MKQTIISVTGHLECSSFDPMSAELVDVAATAPVSLLIAQVRVEEKRRGILKQVTRAQSRPANLSSLHSRGGPKRYLSHIEQPSFDPTSAKLCAVAATAPVPLLVAKVRVVECNEGESSNK